MLRIVTLIHNNIEPIILVTSLALSKPINLTKFKARACGQACICVSRHTSGARFSLMKAGNTYRLGQGFSNFFCWRPKNLSEKSRDPQEILRPSKCVITKLVSSMFGLFAVLYTKFFFFSNLATLFEHLATLKRVATPRLRTAGLGYA